MSTSRSALVERIADVLAGHPVEFAMLFGSAVREDAAEPGDVDLAVAFTDDPGDAVFSDTYLGLVTALEDSLGVDVDLVTFASMSPAIRSVVLEEGIVVVGDESQRDEISRRFGRTTPSAAEARERVAAAANRLTDRGS